MLQCSMLQVQKLSTGVLFAHTYIHGSVLIHQVCAWSISPGDGLLAGVPPNKHHLRYFLPREWLLPANGMLAHMPSQYCATVCPPPAVLVGLSVKGFLLNGWTFIVIFSLSLIWSQVDSSGYRHSLDPLLFGDLDHVFVLVHLTFVM